MKIGDIVHIQPAAWARYVKEGGPRPGEKFNPGAQEIVEIVEAPPEEEPRFMLAFPSFWWREEDLTLAAPGAPKAAPPSLDSAEVTRAFCAMMEMWGRRYDYDLSDVADNIAIEGEPFLDPVVVSLEQLTVAHTELMSVIRAVNPGLYAALFAEGGTPDAPLPPDPSTASGEAVVTDLDEVRIRMGQEFSDEAVAYVEAIWGKTTYAFNAAIRDLEAMRRGIDDKSLRRPVTYHEGMHLVLHVRALANDLARNFGMDHLVRDEDDLRGEKR